jgi:Putative Flp pilus-assembly TadE/G-like
MNRQRGQTLPVWLFGLLTSLMLTFMVFNYANAVRWQIRAQNAADGLAQSIMSVQAQHYNKILMNLHAAAIEEWRIRKTMGALLSVMQGTGGCGPAAGHDGRNCDLVYNSLRANYIADVTRYGQDVQQMAALTQYTQAQQINDMETIAQNFENNCNGTGPNSGDCAFKYTLVNPTQRCGLSGVGNNARGIEVGAGAGAVSFSCASSDLSPLEVEVDTCAQITPLIGAFFKMANVRYFAIGRAAATDAMVTQEWMNPGVLNNPNSGGNFQEPEFPEDSSGTAPTTCSLATCYSSGNFCNSNTSGYDWYAIHWCSNNWTSNWSASNPQGYTATLGSDEFSIWTGWWSALPISPGISSGSHQFTPSVGAGGNCSSEPWYS